jgi:biopolymer transport protein ExbB
MLMSGAMTVRTLKYSVAALALLVLAAIPVVAQQSPSAPSEPPAGSLATPPSAPVQPPPSTPTQPSAAPTAAPPAQQIIGAGNLPRDLSVWSMFTSADWLVKGVMLSLVFASLVTWTVWFAKSIELMIARRRLKSALRRISSQRTLYDAQAAVGTGRGVVQALVAAAQLEIGLSSDVTDKDGIKERVATRLARIEAAAGREMNRGTGVLATIGSTAPFVGLFGTVWGIMNSFIGISKAQTTNLAVVAPGIAEALLATAIGLFAAIPAVIIYNQFARSVTGYKALVADAAAEVQRLVSRDLDRASQPYARARAAE